MGGESVKRPMIAAAIVALFLSLFVLKASILAIVVLLILSVGLLILCAFFEKIRAIIIVFVVAIVILAVTLFQFQCKIAKINEIPNDTPLEVTGIITSEYYHNGKAVYTLKTDSANKTVPSNIKVNVYSRFVSLKAGDRVKCNMYVEAISPENRANYYSKGVFMSASISKLLDSSQSTTLTGTLARFRESVSDVLFKYLSPESAASVNALTVGDKYYISNDFDSFLKRSGVSHIMVVSGMHLAIICGFALKLLRMVGLGKRLSAVLAAVFVFMFMALCGFSVSVMRAGIMYFIMLASLFLIRRTDALNSLSVAVCVIIILNPFSVGSAAFMLSVFSSAGIIILNKPMADKINSLLHIEESVLSNLTDAVTVTLSAFIFTLPLSVYYFGYFSIVAIITNFLIGFAVNIALISAALALPFALIFEQSVIAKWLFSLTEYITRYFNFIIEYFGSRNYAAITVDKTRFLITFLAIIFSFGIIKYRDYILRVVKKLGSSNRAGSKG